MCCASGAEELCPRDRHSAWAPCCRRGRGAAKGTAAVKRQAVTAALAAAQCLLTWLALAVLAWMAVEVTGWAVDRYSEVLVRDGVTRAGWHVFQWLLPHAEMGAGVAPQLLAVLMMPLLRLQQA